MSALPTNRPSPGPNPAFAAFAGGSLGATQDGRTGAGRAGAGGAGRVQAEEQVLFEPEEVLADREPPAGSRRRRTSAEEPLEGLNEPQRAAATHAGAPPLGVRGAGSGQHPAPTTRAARIRPVRAA